MSRILLAEDNDLNRELMREILEGFGHQVVVVENGRQAIEEALKSPPDLAIFDIQMPELDGLAAVQELRSLPRLEDLRVLALTAYAMSEEKERILQAGFDGYISKPFQIQTLKAEIERQLQRGTAGAAD